MNDRHIILLPLALHLLLRLSQSNYFKTVSNCTLVEEPAGLVKSLNEQRRDDSDRMLKFYNTRFFSILFAFLRKRRRGATPYWSFICNFNMDDLFSKAIFPSGLIP